MFDNACVCYCFFFSCFYCWFFQVWYFSLSSCSVVSGSLGSVLFFKLSCRHL